MSDHVPDEEPDSGVADVEALLRELDLDDLEPVAPPAHVWAGIEAATAPIAPVRTLRRRPSSGTWLLVAAAVLVAVVGTTVLLRRDRDASVVSAVALRYDAGSFDPRGADAAGRVELVDHEGGYELRLSDLSLPQVTDADLELWLIEPDAAGNPVDIEPVSVLRSAGEQTYEVPAGLDPASHYVVDVSIEPRDGDATHSGHSILRGALQGV